MTGTSDPRRSRYRSPYYRPELARIHDLGFGFHAERCAPGILAALAPVRERGGTVLELGCGSGRLTRQLVDAGHAVIASDASEAMLEIARRAVPDAREIRRLTLPDDPLLEADAVVAIGHVLNYLPGEEALLAALDAVAACLRPGGVLALDIQDRAWGRAYVDAPSQARVAEDWALVSEFDVPEPGRFVRRHISFTPAGDGLWRRDEEVHENVLIDVASLPARLAAAGVACEVRDAFGDEELPEGLLVLRGVKE